MSENVAPLMVQVIVDAKVTMGLDKPITVPVAVLPPEHPAGGDPINGPLTVKWVPSDTIVTLPENGGTVAELDVPGTMTVLFPAVQVDVEEVAVSKKLPEETWAM